MEYRLRCNVCGKVWCFSDEDLKKNQGNAALSGLAALGGIAAALGGTTAQQHLNYDMSQRAASVQRADHILVLDDGALAGDADHATLLRTCPVYKEICLSQLSKEEVAKTL